VNRLRANSLAATEAGGRPSRPIHRALILAGIVMLYLLRASDTFVSDHATGDQRGYVGIAMKLQRSGFREYNLFHISRVAFPGGLEYVWSQERDGELIEALRSEGMGFLAHTLFHSPPLFPYLLCFSHRMFAPGIGYDVLFPAAARGLNMSERLKVQLYSSVVPLVFGVVLVVATFLLAQMICGYWTAVIAALLIACSPAVLFASERLWQDVPLAALVTLTMLFLLRHLESDDPGWFLLAVVSCSLALLAKNTTVLLAPAVVLAMAHRAYRRGGGVGKALRETALRAGAFLLLCSVLVFPWFFTAWRTWGTPFYNAGEEGISRVHYWFVFLKSRPWYTYAVTIPVMVPLFSFGYYRIVTMWRSRARFDEMLLGVWFLSFFVVLTLMTSFSEQLGPDSRYMLPAYPPLAILAAAQVLRVRDSLANRAPASVARWAVAGAILLSCAWSYRLSDLGYATFPRIYRNFMNMPF